MFCHNAIWGILFGNSPPKSCYLMRSRAMRPPPVPPPHLPAFEAEDLLSTGGMLALEGGPSAWPHMPTPKGTNNANTKWRQFPQNSCHPEGPGRMAELLYGRITIQTPPLFIG